LALRLGGSGDPAAVADAAFFATLPGARGRGGSPIPAVSAEDEIALLAGDGLAVVEAGAGEDSPALAQALGAASVPPSRGLPGEDGLLRLQDVALALGARFLGVVLTALSQSALHSAAGVMDDAALPLLAAVGEDRVLYAPTIAEIVESLDADLLLG